MSVKRETKMQRECQQELTQTIPPEKQLQLEQALRKRVMGNAYIQHLGVELLELKPGYAYGRMPHKKELANPYGFVHGGCLYSLADIIAGNAACMNGRYVTTVSGSMNYLQPAMNTDYVYCEAKQLRSGKHLAVFEVRICDEKGALLDSGEFTFFYSGSNVVID